LLRIKNILLLVNTLKYLKWRQVYFRVVRKFNKPKVSDDYQGFSPARSIVWLHVALYEEKIVSTLNARFLNHTKKLDFPIDWDNEVPSKLWVYNLHYFEDLLADKAHDKLQFHRELLSRWVDDNVVGVGNGWEPYPTSLRIVNVLKAWLGGLDLEDKILSSVFSQASYLSNDLEKHLLGNHYFVNLKALLFAGVIFENSRWIKIAQRGLLVEIPEQILEDGANFELSPMYHSLILVDMLDMLNLSIAYPGRINIDLVSLVERDIPKMLTFMNSMSHPDLGVSFFNDSVGGIAPAKAKIESYANKLGIDIRSFSDSIPPITVNGSSGYMCASLGGNKLIFDAAAVGPDYIPGHAHADTLSFELSVGSQRVFVNSGISEYGLGPTRVSQRKTASHNTVEVDCKDSSEVWSGFRVAQRAKILSKSAFLDHEGSVVFQAAHGGYKSVFGGCVHDRKITLGINSLTVLDSLKGSFLRARCRFYICPDLEVSLVDNILLVIDSDFILRTDLSGQLANLVESSWHPEFGVSIPNKVLEIDFQGSHLATTFTWINQ